MKLTKILRLSFNMLIHSKLRSWLTIIGIIIGVGAVVVIISLGQGLQQSINSQIAGFGQDLITITPGGSNGFGGGTGVSTRILSNKDIQALRLIPGITTITGAVSGSATVVYQSKNVSLPVQGYDPAVFQDFITTSLSSGRSLASGDSGVVVLGNNVANTIFSRKIEVGGLISINDKPFRVVGIFNLSGGFMGGDNVIYMSTADARNVLGNTVALSSDEYSFIEVQVQDASIVTEVSNNIETALINVHHVTSTTEDFSIISAQELASRINAITAGITLFLGAIAAISLLVGGIGVANTMFTSVLEKTRDIGIMKAIGAKNSDILLIFLFNSGFLGFIGGVLGIIFSILVALAVPYIGINLGTGMSFTVPIQPLLLVFAVIFSIVIGMIFGAVPAYRASRLSPVEALRRD